MYIETQKAIFCCASPHGGIASLFDGSQAGVTDVQIAPFVFLCNNALWQGLPHPAAAMLDLNPISFGQGKNTFCLCESRRGDRVEPLEKLNPDPGD